MIRFAIRFALLVLSATGSLLPGAALAQTHTLVTDGVVTKACTTSVLTGTVLTLGPQGCLAATTSDPVFTVRVAPASITQPATGSSGAQVAYVFVDADRDIPAGATYGLTLELCAANCTPGGGWYMFRYAELGGAGFLPQNQVTSGSFNFTFTPGAHTAPQNLRSMGVAQIEVPNSPLFGGPRVVTLGVKAIGASSSATTATFNIVGGAPSTGVDYDINGQPIPDAPLVITDPNTPQCEYPVGGPGSPGPNKDNVCGAYAIPVGDCTSGMTGANQINKAYLLQIENYPGARIGNGMWFGLARDAAMVFKFKTGPTSAFTVLPRPFTFTLEEQSSHGPTAHRFMTISEKRCDFDYSKLYVPNVVAADKANFCFVSEPVATSITGEISATGITQLGKCGLKPDTTYYLNVRWEYAKDLSSRGTISCPANVATCGSILGVN